MNVEPLNPGVYITISAAAEWIKKKQNITRSFLDKDRLIPYYSINFLFIYS
jgi:hypothetical protein